MRLSDAITSALIASMACIAITVHAATRPNITFVRGATSTGWIDFEYWSKKDIFIPVKINGHRAKALLVTGLPVSDIDKTFAADVGLQQNTLSTPTADQADNLLDGLTIQIGNLMLANAKASLTDFTALSHHIEHEIPFMLGDDAFNGLAVDIDFAHHRIRFSDPDHQTIPADAISVPLIRVDDTPLVPVSVEGVPQAQFEMGIGNSGDMLIYQPYYESHKLLEGRRFSKRLGIGSGGIVPEPVGLLKRVTFAGFTFMDMPAAFIPSSLAGTKSPIISGDLGLPVLARFRLIIDYSHHRLYVVPNRTAFQKTFARDRLGLWLNKKGGNVVAEFVAPGSPAQIAGFRTGDKVAKIDGKPAQDWSEQSLSNLRYEGGGTRLRFTLQDGTIRNTILRTYY